MARYFFDLHDGDMQRDTIGLDCTGCEAIRQETIRQEAMRALPEIAKARIPMNGDTQAYTVSVRNERNITVYTATLAFAGVWMGEDVPSAEDDPLD